MRRYSIIYFIKQSIKGLWYNGVMSLASVSVLISCLIVIGSFSLLIYNVNCNLNEVGDLNYIICFVDTDREVAEVPPAADAGAEAGDGTEDSSAEEDLSSDTAAFLPTEKAALADIAGGYLNDDKIALADTVTAKVSGLRAFTDLDEAYATVTRCRKMLAALRWQQMSGELTATEGVSLGEQIEVVRPLYDRIALLWDLREKMLALENVSTVDFTSRAAALEEMRGEYAEHTDLFDQIDPGEGVLTDKYTITYIDNDKVSTLQYHLEHLDGHLYKVSCRSDIASTLEDIREGVIFVFLWFLVILFVVSIFVIINTVKLAVFARREEISIMRYVGATSWFISLPFILEGVIIGLLSGGIAFFLQKLLYQYVQTMMTEQFRFVTFVTFGEVWHVVLIAFLLIGIFTGVVGSSISLHKYTKA